MKIVVYTTSTCEFSKQEKAYLQKHNLQFEERNIETNKDFLAEMMTVGNNFAGTPVTKIEKDDGTISVLKGFTEEEFNNVLGLEAKPEPSPSPTTPTPPPVTVEPTVAPTPAVTAPQAPVPPVVDDTPLNGVMSKLQSQMNTDSTPPPPPAPVAPTNPPQPEASAQENTAANPAIPDFPAK